MDPATLAGVCALIAAGRPAPALPAGVACPASATVETAPIRPETVSFLKDALKAPAAREAIARVAYAEAGDQGDSGLAAVVYAILNRLADGRWGFSVDAVVNARGQFEPVMRAGGDWRGLAAVSAPELARIDTMLNLALDGRLPDLTHGARFFQNPVIVARRARDGQVSANLVNFGGAAPSAVIGAHAFYAEAGRGGGGARIAPAAARPAGYGIFVGADAPPASAERTTEPAPAAPSEPARGDPGQALFVGADGVVRGGPR
jgi:N-acetylmuramoyl-L-alanine amidase